MVNKSKYLVIILIVIIIAVILLAIIGLSNNMFFSKNKGKLSLRLEKSENNNSITINAVFKNEGKSDLKILTSYIRIGEGDIPSVQLESEGKIVESRDARALMGQPPPDHYWLHQDEFLVLKPGEEYKKVVFSLNRKDMTGFANEYKHWLLNDYIGKEVVLKVSYNVKKGELQQREAPAQYRGKDYPTDLSKGAWEGELNAEMALTIK